MSQNLKKLLELVAEFPKRKRVEYDNPEDREFCNNVLIALKQAAPDLIEIEARASSQTWPFVMQFAKYMEAKLALNRHKGDWKGMTIEELVKDLDGEVLELKAALAGEGPNAVRYECADIANFCMMIEDFITSQSPVRAAGGSPNSVAPSTPETERNTHSPGLTPNTGGTGALSGRKEDTSGTPAASSSKLTAARKAAASSKTASSKAQARNQRPKAGVAPQPPPPAIPETAKV